jgi:hypothetical protein
VAAEEGHFDLEDTVRVLGAAGHAVEVLLTREGEEAVGLEAGHELLEVRLRDAVQLDQQLVEGHYPAAERIREERSEVKRAPAISRRGDTRHFQGVGQ